MKLKKKMFSHWCGDFDDELIIEVHRGSSRGLADQILQDQKLRELIERDIKRCFGELRCPKNETYAKQLQKLLEGSKK